MNKHLDTIDSEIARLERRLERTYDRLDALNRLRDDIFDTELARERGEVSRADLERVTREHIAQHEEMALKQKIYELHDAYQKKAAE